MSLEHLLHTDPDAFIADQLQFGATNLQAVTQARNSLPQHKLEALAPAYAQGIVAKLERRFPQDALNDLTALTIVADQLTDTHVDLDTLRAGIMETVGLPTDTTHLTTRQALETIIPFFGTDRLDDQGRATLTRQATAFITEAARRVATSGDETALEGIIPVFRLLAFNLKADSEYRCEAEFDALARMAVHQDRLQIVIGSEQDAIGRGEVLSKGMRKR